MATREENLKKINDELEKLSDEQLEEIAGGTYSQTTRDSKFLHALLIGTKNAPEQPKVVLGFIEVLSKKGASVKDAWNSLGIEFKQHDWDTNEYIVKDTGKSLTQAQAWTYASKLLGRE